jgi:hypothetical protein
MVRRSSESLTWGDKVHYGIGLSTVSHSQGLRIWVQKLARRPAVRQARIRFPPGTPQQMIIIALMQKKLYLRIDTVLSR